MAVDVVMPQMGESIFEGTITKWLKKPGDKVERDEPLFEISTDKVDAEIPSPSAGVLKEIKVAEGQTVPIQTVVAVIDGGRRRSQRAGSRACKGRSAKARALSGRPQAPSSAAAPAQAKAAPAPAAPAAAEAQPRPPHAIAGKDSQLAARPAPRQRKQYRSDASPRHRRRRPHQQEGHSWRHRRRRRPLRDLRPRHLRQPHRRPPAAPRPMPTIETAVPREKMYFGNYEVQPMSVMRQKIAEHMVLSKRVSPHVYSVDEADVTAIAKSSRENESEVRGEHRDEADLHAVLRPRRRRSAARVSDREFLGRRHEHRPA